MRRNQVIFSYFRDELLKTLYKRPFAHGAHHLHHPISVILPRQLPETREREGFKQIRTIDVRLGITLPFEGKHSVGSGADRAINHARKMNTQEWKIGIGHWINQRLYEIPLFGHQLVILTTERDDFRARIDATEAGHAITKQAGAINDGAGRKPSVRCFDDLTSIYPAEAVNTRTDLHSSALCTNQFKIFRRNVPVVDDPG